MAAYRLGQYDQALRSSDEALESLDKGRTDHQQQRAVVLENKALIVSSRSRSDADALYRQALEAYRRYLASGKCSDFEKGVFASGLINAARNVEPQDPDAAERLFDESIALRKEACAGLPGSRLQLSILASTQAEQSQLLRSRAEKLTSADDPRAAELRKKSDDLWRDAVISQRRCVSLFALLEDRLRLVNFLHQSAEHLLQDLVNQSGKGSEADALLTEAIQLGRTLVAEFPDSTNYKNRLAKLERAHSQHFGSKSAESPTSTP